MSEQLLIALINFGTKFGIAAAIEIAKGIKGPAPTIDDAIAALERAESKSLAQYKAEAPNSPNLPPVP